MHSLLTLLPALYCPLFASHERCFTDKSYKRLVVQKHSFLRERHCDADLCVKSHSALSTLPHCPLTAFCNAQTTFRSHFVPVRRRNVENYFFVDRTHPNTLSWQEVTNQVWISQGEPEKATTIQCDRTNDRGMQCERQDVSLGMSATSANMALINHIRARPTRHLFFYVSSVSQSTVSEELLHPSQSLQPSAYVVLYISSWALERLSPSLFYTKSLPSW